MEGSESLDILFKHAEKDETAVKSYSCVTLFMQIEEYMLCI